MATATVKTASKKATKATKAAPATREKKDGLRKPQVRVLQFLAKQSKPQPRTVIAEKSPVDQAMLNSYIGSSDPAIRAKNDKAVCVSLLTLQYVKAELPAEENGATCYTITAKGKAALAKV